MRRILTRRWIDRQDPSFLIACHRVLIMSHPESAGTRALEDMMIADGTDVEREYIRRYLDHKAPGKGGLNEDGKM